MKKQIQQALNQIKATSGKRKTPEITAKENTAWETINKKMVNMTVDIDAAEFLIDPRYTLQEVDIPEKKRGNLSAFAGKSCYVFTTTVSRSGARINFYICEA